MRTKRYSLALPLVLALLLGGCTPVPPVAEPSADIPVLSSPESAPEPSVKPVIPTKVLPLLVNGNEQTEPAILSQFSPQEYERGNAGIYSSTDAFLVLETVFLYELNRNYPRSPRNRVAPLVYTNAETSQLIDKRALTVVGADSTGVYYTKPVSDEDTSNELYNFHLAITKNKQVVTNSLVQLVHYNVLTGATTLVQKGVAEPYLEDGYLYWVDTQNPTFTIIKQSIATGERTVLLDAKEYEAKKGISVLRGEERIALRVAGSTVYLHAYLTRTSLQNPVNRYGIDTTTGAVDIYYVENPDAPLTLEYTDYVGEYFDPEQGIEVNGHTLLPNKETPRKLLNEEGTVISDYYSGLFAFYNEDKTLLYLPYRDYGYLVTDGETVEYAYLPPEDAETLAQNVPPTTVAATVVVAPLPSEIVPVLPLAEQANDVSVEECAADPYPYGLLFQSEGSIYFLMSFYYENKVELFRVIGTAEDWQAVEWVRTFAGDYMDVALTGPYIVHSKDGNSYEIVRFG